MAVSLVRRFGGLPLCFFVLAACGAATGDDLVPPGADAGTDALFDAGAPVPDSSQDSPHDSGPGRACTSRCTSDYECQATCPAAPNMGINCCDIPSGTCFAALPGMCPAFPMDAGMD